jgi:hypothetical protein
VIIVPPSQESNDHDKPLVMIACAKHELIPILSAGWRPSAVPKKKHVHNSVVLGATEVLPEYKRTGSGVTIVIIYG